MPSPSDTKKLTVLHIGDDIKYNPSLYASFAQKFTIIQPSLQERHRDAFIAALKENRWGEFHAILRPFWNTGGEMGRWDAQLVPHLPPTCKIFASAGAGYDWADIPVLSAHGITYCNGARASSEAVADMALWHILSVFRNLIWSAEAAKSGDEERFREAHMYQQDTAHNPRGKSLGIIGLGNIGFMIAQKVGSAFGMRVLYHDVVRKAPEQEDAVQATFFPELEAMLKEADCVVLATPFNGEKLITKETLAMFKKGSRFVNIARGTLVDEAALVEALQSGHLFAAGLDVHENEPHVNRELCQMRNVTMTSHNAGGAWETASGFERLAIENVESFLLKGEALTPVNAELVATEKRRSDA
jgi:lactate dehydrogenase-like 2-hydroxyacid dehydrogenase